MSKATAAKARSKAEAAPQESPEAEEEPSAKKQKLLAPDQRLMNDGQTLLKRCADGKVKGASAEQVQLAKQGLDIMKTLGRDDKMEFAKKVEQTKGSKNFAWVRTFSEHLKTRNTTRDGVIENYYTRTVMADIMGHVGDTWG